MLIAGRACAEADGRGTNLIRAIPALAKVAGPGRETRPFIFMTPDTTTYLSICLTFRVSPKMRCH